VAIQAAARSFIPHLVRSGQNGGDELIFSIVAAFPMVFINWTYRPFHYLLSVRCPLPLPTGTKSEGVEHGGEGCEEKRVGQTPNMLDIVTAMQLADSVVSL
jgi:hypothetical protein